MALDPSIILHAGEFKTPDYAQTMELRSQIQARNLAAARSGREEAQSQARATRLADIGRRAATGDVEGAKAEATAAGDFDILEKLKGLDNDKRELLRNRATSAAPLAYQAGKMPYEQRKAFITQQAPALLANGWTQQELEAFDPTDQNLSGIVSSAQSIGDMLAREDKEAERTLRSKEADATRNFQRGNAYISAGLIPPGEGGAPAAGVGGADLVSRMLPITVHSESRGNPNAVSPKGARGLMQVMPTTNADPGFGVKPAADGTEAERVRVGQDYLAAMMERYGNDPSKAWAAYNAGPGRLDSALSRGKDNWLAMMPKETRNYVRTNLAALGGGGGDGGGGAAPAATPGGLTPIPGGKLDPNKPHEAPAGYRWSADRQTLEAIPGGPGDKQGRQANLKMPPAKALTDYTENLTTRSQLDEAIRLLDPRNNSPEAKAAREAIGPGTGMLGETFSQLHDPKGTDFRAKIGRIGGVVIKDISGAAVSATEDARLKKWVPVVGDTADAARSKLINMRNALDNFQGAFADTYNEDNGYRALRSRGTLSAPAGARRAAPAAASGPKVGTVEGGYRFKGGNPAMPASWEKVR